MTSRCFQHGEHKITDSERNQDFVDFNTALRGIIKGAFMIEEDRENETLSVMISGGDWSGVWALRVHCEALLELGYSKIATQIFTPIITDWSGAKFSKSLYVRTGAYEYLSKELIDFSDFLPEYGMEGFFSLEIETKVPSNETFIVLSLKEIYLEKMLDGRKKTNTDVDLSIGQ